MSFAVVLILVLGVIVSGILLIKQTAKKFSLTDEQLNKIKNRNEELDKNED